MPIVIGAGGVERIVEVSFSRPRAGDVRARATPQTLLRQRIRHSNQSGLCRHQVLKCRLQSLIGVGLQVLMGIKAYRSQARLAFCITLKEMAP